jgi:hypothetical protein
MNKQLTERQIVAILKETEAGISVPELILNTD